MIKSSNKINNILILFFSLVLSFILMKILLTTGSWYQVFTFLNVPAGGTDVADAKSIQDYSTKFYKNGFVPIDAVDFWNRKYSAINIIWLKLSLFFKFHIPNNFYIFVFVMFFCYIFSVLKVALINKKILDFFIIFLSLLSTSSFYLIERGNFDLILFALTVFLIFFNNTAIKFSLIILLSFLKINLICLFVIIVQNIKTFFLCICTVLLIMSLNYNYILKGYVNIGSAADILHYGLFTITKSCLHFFNNLLRLDLNINQATTKIGILFLLFLIFSIFYAFIKYVNFKKVKWKKLEINFTKKEELFFLGSFFYIFSFLTFSAPDYKLVFLILALPFFLDNKSLFWKEIVLIFILLNSSIFEVFALRDSIFSTNITEIYTRFGYRYFVLGALVHSLKIFLFYLLLKHIFKIYKKKIIAC